MIVEYNIIYTRGVYALLIVGRYAHFRRTCLDHLDDDCHFFFYVNTAGVRDQQLYSIGENCSFRFLRIYTYHAYIIYHYNLK